MIVRHIEVTAEADGYTLSAVIESEGMSPFRLEYVVQGIKAPEPSVTGNAFLAATLLPAMLRHEPLVIEAPVSARLLESTETLMAIYQAWVSGAHRVEVTAPATHHALSSDNVGAFFSGGVDSFYTLLKHRPDHHRISYLVLIDGFDFDELNRPLFAEAVRRAQRVADETDRHLIVVHTNLRVFADPLTDWIFYYGGALASVGLALEGFLHVVFIAAPHAYQELSPSGCHPLLDRHWSTEAIEFIHDGAEALRTKKIAAISHSSLAVENLRVCPRKKSRTYNCGACEKCLRTMIGLHAAGALNRATTFPHTIDHRAVRRMRLELVDSGLRFLEDLLGALGSSPRDQQIKAALRHVIRRTLWKTGAFGLARRYLGPHATDVTVAALGRLQGGVARRIRRLKVQ